MEFEIGKVDVKKNVFTNACLCLKFHLWRFCENLCSYCSGIVTVNQLLDRERTDSYNLVISATDNNPERVSSTAFL